jgi:hypothetical protein
VVLAGGLVAGGLAIFAALPEPTGPVPPTAGVVGAAAVAVATVVAARRLRPLPQGRGRR